MRLRLYLLCALTIACRASHDTGSDMSSTTGDLAQGASDLGAISSDLAGSARDFAGTQTVTVSGTVSTRVQPMVNGVPIAVMGASPVNQTTTDITGMYRLKLPASAIAFIAAEPGSPSGYMSTEEGIVTPGTTVVNFMLTSTAAYQQTAAFLSPPFTVDSAKGVVIATFDGAGGTNGGYGATLSSSHGMSFTNIGNVGGNPTYSSTSAQGNNILVFPNVAVGTTTVAAVPPMGKTCTPSQAITNYRVDAGTITIVRFSCP
jgi:hypothetical protein